MKVPYNWLREYVPGAPDDIAAATEALTLSGTKVEALHSFGVPGGDNGGGEGYRVGQVVAFEQHPNADRLRLCKVDVGEGEPRQIVCGASNFTQGDRVAVVLPGATLPGGDTLGSAKLRGIESFGMMLSERELELSNDHAGIMILPGEWQVGAPLGQYIPLGDTVVEFEITPNRPDCLGVHGLARELAAVHGLELLEPFAEDAEATADGTVADHVSVDLQAPDLCPRYMARAFVDVTVGPSPHWLRARLMAAGMRPINNVVDITNYAMLATGQPLHAFDADQLRGGTIIVRRAREGERVTTLDDVERTLTTDMLSIADAEQTAVVAGVMGAADVEVTESTNRLVLEAACFSGRSIMETSLALGLRSESSSRFEKGLDPRLPEVALRFASRLLVDLCGARMVPGTVDAQGPDGLPDVPVIELEAGYVSHVLGMDVSRGVERDILTRLGYVVNDLGREVVVTVPHWRSLDTTRPIDLVEEVGRIDGLHRLPATLPARRAAIGALTPAQRLQRALEDAAVGIGLHEAVTYSLVPLGHNERFDGDPASEIRLDNPMTVDHAVLRTSLVGSHLEVVRHNRAMGAEDVAIFELGRSFSRVREGTTDASGLARYSDERRVFALCATGTLIGGRYDAPGVPADLPTAAGIVEALLRAIGVTVALRPFEDGGAPGFLHPGQAAQVLAADGSTLGWVGTAHPSVAREYDVRSVVVLAELDLSAVEAALPQLVRYRAISSFPPVRQDIAVLVPVATLAGDVLAEVRTAGGDLLEHVAVFDRYEGEQVPEGQCSLALRLAFRAADRTLTDEEVVAVRDRITAALAERFGARLREG